MEKNSVASLEPRSSRHDRCFLDSRNSCLLGFPAALEAALLTARQAKGVTRVQADEGREVARRYCTRTDIAAAGVGALDSLSCGFPIWIGKPLHNCRAVSGAEICRKTTLETKVYQLHSPYLNWTARPASPCFYHLALMSMTHRQAWPEGRYHRPFQLLPSFNILYIKHSVGLFHGT